MLYQKFIVRISFASALLLALGLIPSTVITYSAPLNTAPPTAPIDLRDTLTYSLPHTTETTPIPEEEVITHDTGEESESSLPVTIEEQKEADEETTTKNSALSIFTVPFFSQFKDITSPQWKKVGCGIASLAMLIKYYNPDDFTSVDTLLQEGIDADAYLSNAGWSYAGLIEVSNKYNLDGTTHDLAGSSMDVAFGEFEEALKEGPLMASVHYTFVPTNPIPHLVIVNGIKNDTLYYNDPAEPSGNGSISVEQFKSAWKKRYIEFYVS